jgi:hypothetical protein
MFLRSIEGVLYFCLLVKVLGVLQWQQKIVNNFWVWSRVSWWVEV